MSVSSSSTKADISRYLRARLPLALAVVWLTAMVILYYVVHNPLDAARGFSFAGLAARIGAAFAGPDRIQVMVSALGLNLVDVVAVGLLVAVGGGIGALVLPGRPIPDVERPVLQVLAGLGVISILVLTVGMLGLFPARWLAWAVAIVLALALHRQIIAWVRGLASSCRDLFRPSPDRLIRWLQWAILILLALPLLVALLPPHNWDALTYHLAGPKMYLAAGRIVSFPENHFLGFPQIVEMLYLWLMIVVRPNAAGLLHWCFSVMAILLTMGLARRAGRPGAGVIAAAGLLACDSLWDELIWPYNDLALVAFVLAAISAALTSAEAQGRGRDRLLVTAGVFVGLAMGTKYTAAGAAVGAAALVGWLVRKEGLGAAARACGMVSVAALVAFSPWLIKNTIFDGNPVSPFVRGTREFDQFDQYYYLRPGTGLDPVSVLFAPIQATVFGKTGFAPYGGSTGVLTFVLMPLALFGWKRRSQTERDLIGQLAVFAAPAYVIWLAGVATSWFLVQNRLLYPVFPAFLVIGGLGVEGLLDQRPVPNPALVARLIAAAASVIAIWGALFPTLLSGYWLTGLGLVSDEDYLAERLGAYYVAMAEVNALPSNARIQFLWEPRTMDCQRPCIPDSMIDQWWHDRQVEPDPHKIVQKWRGRGITHVLIFEGGLNFLITEEKYDPLTSEDVAALDEIRRSDLISVWSIKDAYSLYEIREAAP